MKKSIATIAIIILMSSGSITAAELSDEGCKEMLYAELKGALINEDEETVNRLMQMEVLARTMPENDFALAGIIKYCISMEILMELFDIKENSPEWHKQNKKMSAGE